MRYRDEVILKEDMPELNLKKGSKGAIARPRQNDKKWYISGLRKGPIDMPNKSFREYISEEYLEFVEDPEVVMARSCDDEDIDEYDIVELVVDRDEYKKEGITIGITGIVLSGWPARGGWLVEFADEEKDYYPPMTTVKGKDLRIVKKT